MRCDPIRFTRLLLGMLLLFDVPLLSGQPTVHAEDARASLASRAITGSVRNQDLRRVPQAIVQIKDQEGNTVAETVSDLAGDFTVQVPGESAYSVSATQEDLRSEYVIIKVGADQPAPVKLTLGPSKELALEVVAPLPPLQYKASSETYALSRKEIEALPRGNNIELPDLLSTIPSATQNALRQVHIRQEHANLQFRIDGVPIPDTVSTVFADVISPRTFERADILLGGLPAEYGNRHAAVIDVTTKSGTTPARGSVQMFGGSNETLNPSFEYGGAIGSKFRYYALNSYTSTNRGIEPPTQGHSSIHNHSERNQTYLRGDYQLDNRNNFTALVLNSVASFRIPTDPTRTPDPMTTPIGFTPSLSSDINERQKEDNQYGHLVWRHDLDASSFFSLAGYLRRTRATFLTDFSNGLSYAGGSASSQDRLGLSTGVRLDYTNRLNVEHTMKAGFQVDRTQAISKTRTATFPDLNGDGMPDTVSVQFIEADNRKIGHREEFWIQDQYTPTDRLTLNLGLRYDHIKAYTQEGQVSPRVGMTYKFDQHNVAHVFYGRLFTPASIEAVRVLPAMSVGTTAQPENSTANPVQPERSHYFEAGFLHAFGPTATVQVVGYYKLNRHLLDEGQFGTTPLLVPFNFGYGFQRGVDTSLKMAFTPQLTGRFNVAWGQSKAKGLESGHFLLEQAEIDAINSRSVYLDHMQEVTSSAVLSYVFKERTTVTGQMLYGSGVRRGDGVDVNRFHVPSYTTYNLSLNHIVPMGGTEKLVLGFDVINLLDQTYAYNIGSGIGFGVTHYAPPRSFFFRASWNF